MDGGGSGVDAGCAAALGEVVGLDWEGFGEEPHRTDGPDALTSVVVGGVYSFVGSELGNVAGLDALDPRELLYGEPAAVAGLASEDPAGAFWFDYLTDRLVRLRHHPREGCLMSYVGNGVVDLCPESTVLADPAYASGLAPVAVAAALAHEAAHYDGPAHRTVDGSTTFEGDRERTVDPDPGGAYGVEARWLESWLHHQSGAVPAADCEVAADMLADACAHILDTAGWAPCAPRAWCAG